jgi:general stress protein YciG
MTTPEISKYMAEIGRKGGTAGKGESKRRTHEQAVKAGKASAEARLRNKQ